jgi:hypothetical protein
MVTHRERIGDPAQIDVEVPGWLKQAYEAAWRNSSFTH